MRYRTKKDRILQNCRRQCQKGLLRLARDQKKTLIHMQTTESFQVRRLSTIDFLHETNASVDFFFKTSFQFLNALQWKSAAALKLKDAVCKFFVL